MEHESNLLPNGATSLARGLEILRCFSAREPALSNSQLASYTGLPKSTVSRLTKTLVELGYLRHDKKRRQYRIGPSVLSLGYAALSNLRVIDIARPHMQSLAEATDALISLAIRDRLSMLYIEACSSDANLTLKMGRGVHMPMLTTSIGRAFLASLPNLEREYLITQIQSEHPQENQVDILAALNEELAFFNKNKYCRSFGEWNKDVNAVSAPIQWSEGTDLVVMSISGPSFIITPRLLEDELVPRLLSLTDYISSQLVL